MKRIAILSLAALASALPADADACGGFFQRRTTTQTVPSLEVEQVLILHDPVSEEEQFIRELVFRDAKEPFGFVVPTPSQPTVAKVERSPFRTLATRFPPEPPAPATRGTSGGGLGGVGGGGKGGGAPPVTVLSQAKIGSFTAFVLAATDASALKKWLDDNELATTPESEAWLKHYVSLGFYFTAFRYDATTKAGGASRAETVRLTFKTPLPFYPYREPKHPKEAKHDRVLAVWFASTERATPIAAVEDAGSTVWKRPWNEANKHAPTNAPLIGAIVGPENMGTLAPPPPPGVGDKPQRQLTMQTFEDQKTSRQGWGDVVFVPQKPRQDDEARLGRMQKLMTTLDASLAH